MTGAMSYLSAGAIRRAAATATVLALGATLTACFDSGPVTAPSGIKLPPVSTVTVTSTATTTTAPRTSSAPSTTSTPTSTRSAGRSTDGAPSGSMLSDVRLGRREGADRLVLQFTGAAPSYRVARGSGPILECGSGAVVGSAGEYLLVTVEPIALHDERGNSPYTGERTVAGPGRAISEAVIFCSFEGTLQVALKLAGSGQGYTDSTLSDPGRIVVDVRD